MCKDMSERTQLLPSIRPDYSLLPLGHYDLRFTDHLFCGYRTRRDSTIARFHRQGTFKGTSTTLPLDHSALSFCLRIDRDHQGVRVALTATVETIFTPLQRLAAETVTRFGILSEPPRWPCCYMFWVGLLRKGSVDGHPTNTGGICKGGRTRSLSDFPSVFFPGGSDTLPACPRDL